MLMNFGEAQIECGADGLCGAGALARERPAALVLQRREVIVQYLVRPLFRFTIPSMTLELSNQIRRKRPRIAGGDVVPDVVWFSHPYNGRADVRV